MAAVDYIQGKLNTHTAIMQKVLWCEAKAKEYTDRAENYKAEAKEAYELVEKLRELQALQEHYLAEETRLKGTISGADDVNSVLEQIFEMKTKAEETAAQIRSLYYAR